MTLRFILILLLVTSSLPSWQWPAERLDTLQSGPPELFVFSLRGLEGEAISVVSPIDGEVVFSGPQVRPFSSGVTVMMPDMPAVVIQSSGDFRVALWINGLRHMAERDGMPRNVTAGQPLGTADSVLFSVYDIQRTAYVNPRMLFPFDSRLPEEVIPSIQFLQNGEIVPAEALTAGLVTLVVPAGDFPLARLPRSIHLLRNGILESHRELVFSESVRTNIDETGNFQLGNVPVSVGSGAFILEGYRFDGSIVRRRINYTVVSDPDSPSETDLDDG